ncbi:MAG: M20/M25/M40 family metallo-hydrolase [Aggregatilineales bacterium]
MQLSDLHNWIDERKVQIEDTFKTFVELNTFTDNTQGVDQGMDMVSRMVSQWGFTVEVINARHRLIKAGNGTAKPRILLISHMDTVFPPEGDFLHYESLPDGYVRGPGVGDIKGGMLMGIWSMLAMQELMDDFDVQMAISANEEKGSPTIRDWYLGGHVGADYAIGLEPGFPQGELSPTVPLGVVYQRRGYGAINFTIHGKASHSGTAHLGLSAIAALAPRITKIHALSDDSRGISTNVGTIAGGISPNTVAGTVTGTASFRFERLADGEEIRDAIQEIITDKYVYNEGLDLWDSAEAVVDAFIPPMERTDSNQLMVDIVLKEAERLGQNVVPIARGGGSDANFVSATGTASICGMGAPTQGIHTDQETIYLPVMFERINLLTSTIYRLIEQNS